MAMFGRSRGGSSQYVAPSGGDDTPQLQALNDAARNNSGGDIQLLPGAIFRLDTPLVLDVGAGVSLRGNGAYLDARNISGTNSAITLASNAPASIKISGVDDNTNNYLQERAIVERFALILSTGGSQTHHGIDVNMSPAVGTRSPRATVRNISIWGGDRQIRHRNRAYLCRFHSIGCAKGRKALSFEGGDDQGEQTIFTGCAFANSTEANIYIDTQPETGTTENVDVTFGEGCSFDYTNSQIIKFVTGYGHVRFQASHFEWNYAGTSSLPPFDLSAAASAQMLWLFDSPNMINTAGSRNYLALFKIGDKHDVRIHDAFVHNVSGAGVQISATAGPGSTATAVETLAELTGTGTIICKDVHTFNPPAAIPRIVSLDDANNWLSDPGFEQTTLIDMWYGSGTVGTIATTAAQAHTGSRSLDIPITGAVSVAKSAKCLVPIKHGARFMGAACFARLSAGSGSADLKVRPVMVAVQVAPGSAPTIQKTGTLVTLNTATLATDGWTRIAHTTSSPRVSIPAWATHIEVIIDCFAINNNGGSVYVDPVWVGGW